MAQPAKKESLGLTTDLAKKLIKAFPQYKGLSEQDFLDMLDKISAVETQDKNIYQLKGGPGRGYYQMELESAPVAYDRALNIQKELKARGIDLPKLPKYNQDFTKLTKDEQAFYTLTKMVGAAGAKRLQGQKDYFLNPKDPKKMWLELHWAGKDVDKPARIKHWEETHGKEALVPQKIKTLKQEITKPTLQPVPQAKKVQTQVEQEIEQPDLHPAGPEKTTLSAPPMLSDKKVKQLTNAKFVPNAMGIPIFTEKGTFAWDKPPGELDILLHGRPGPTMRRAQAVDNAEAVQSPTYAQGGLIKRKDGSYSKRGLWDNIRANRGSKKKPTKEMLRQERKIRAAEKKEDGGDVNPLMNIPESQRLAPIPQRTVTYPEGFIEDKLNLGVPLNFMGQPFATGAIEESISPLDLIGGVRGGMGLIKGAMKYKQAMKPNYIQIGDELFNMGPHPRVVRRATKQMHKGVRDIVLPSAFENGGSIYNWIPPNYPRVGARNEQGGWLDQYAEGGDVKKYARKGEVYNERRADELGYTPDATGHLPSVDYETSEWLKSAQHPTAWKEHLYGYTLNPAVSSGYNLGFDFGGYFGKNQLKYYPKKEDGSWVADSSIPTPTTPSYYPAGPDRTLTNYQMGTPKAPMYAHGATVWNKRLADEQMSAAYVIGPDTKGTQVKNTYPDRMSGAENTTNYKIGDYIPTGMDYKSPAAGTYDYNKDVQPYYTMRLHAPDTRRMAYGGYVPMYKSGGFLRQAGEFAFGALEGTLDTVTGGMTDSLTDMAHDALADAAGTTYDDKAGQRLKRLHGAGKIGGAITGAIVSGNVAGAIGQGAEGTNDILQYSPNASEDLKKWGGLGLNLAQMGSGFMGGANNPTQMANFNASNIGKFAGQAGKVGQGLNMFQSGDVMGMMNMFQPQGMGSFRNGGHITGKYNPPGLRWQQLNPGVSAPEGIYTGPTTQRGVTFADGGDVLEVKPMLAAGPSAAVSTDPRQPKLGVVGMGYAGGKYNPYIQGKAGIQGGSLEAGVSPYFKMGRNFTLNPSLGGGVSTAGLYGKAGLTGMYNLPNNLNFDLYGSAEYMRDSRGNSLPIELGLAWSDTSPLLRTGVSYDPLQKTAGFSVNVPIGAERNLFKYKAKPKSKSRYEDGGEVDITKPYLNPATVQATLASANKPVTNTLGRVISTPASREKERREKIIAKDPSKYSVEDYKKGIQEPSAGNSILDDPLGMAIIATATGGIGLGSKTLGSTAKSFGRNLVSEVTGGLSDLPSISKASFPKNATDLSGTGFKENPYYHYNAFKDKKREIVDALRTPEGRKRLQGYIDTNAQYRPHVLNKSTDEIIDDFDKTQFDVERPIFKDGQWLRDEKGNLIYEGVDPNNAYNWYRDGFNKPAYVSMGQNFTPYDARHILEHEFAHTFQRQLPLSEVDGPLENISLKEDDEFYQFGFNDLKQLFNQYNPFNKTRDVGYSVSGNIYGTSTSLPSYSRSQGLQEAKNYWLEGSGGKEKSPFAAEVRENLRQKGLLKNRYDEITPDLLKQHYKLYNKTKGPKYNLRLYDIMHPTKENFNILSGVLNKMPAVLPAVAVGAQAMQQDNNKKSSGGWLDNL